MWLTICQLADRYQKPPWELAGEEEVDEIWWLIRVSYYSRVSKPMSDQERVLMQLRLEDEAELDEDE